MNWEQAPFIAYIIVVVGLLWRHILMAEKVRKYEWMVFRLSEELRSRGFEVFLDVDESLLSCVRVAPPPIDSEYRLWEQFLGREAPSELVKAMEIAQEELERAIKREQEELERRMLGEEEPPIYNQQGERLYRARDSYDFRPPPIE